MSRGRSTIINGIVRGRGLASESIILRPGLAEGNGDAPILRAIAWLTASRWRSVIFLTLLSLACFVPGLAGIAPVDRDETRFIQSTKQMLETGNYVDIRFQEGTRYKKPIGIYWLQAAAAKLTGYGADAPVGVYRLVSLVGALAAVLLTYWATIPLFGEGAALIAGAAMAVSLVLVGEAHLAKTDAALLATVVLAQGCLARLYMWRGAGLPPLLVSLGFWIGLGLGILIKGPIVLMIAGLTAVTLVIADRKARWLLGLRPLIGVSLALVIVLPWFIAILWLSGNSFIGESVGNDLVGKLAGGSEGHGAPPGTHFVLFWVMFWPAAALTLAAVPWVWRQRGEPAVRFCLAWLIPSFLVFEAVVTKLPHYTMPTFPAVAALIGGAAIAGGLARGVFLGRLPPILAAAGVSVLAVAVIVLVDRLGLGISPLAVALAVIVVAIAVVAGFAAARANLLTAGATLGAAAVGFYLLAFGVAAPTASTLFLSPQLAAAVQHYAGCANPRVASAGYHEASLIFALGTDIRLVNGKQAADFLKGPGCRIALVDADSEKDFLAHAATLGLTVEKRTTVAGLNIGRVAMLSIGLYAQPQVAELR